MTMVAPATKARTRATATIAAAAYLRVAPALPRRERTPPANRTRQRGRWGGRSSAGTAGRGAASKRGSSGYAFLVARSWYSMPMKKPQIRCHTSTANGSFQPSGPSKRKRP